MLFNNDTFLLDGTQMRLLAADSVTDTAWAIQLENDHAWPMSVSFSRIRDLPAIENGTALPTRVSAARQTKCDTAWSRLKPLLDVNGTSLFFPSARKSLLTEHASRFGCSVNTLYKDLRRYWQRGQSKYALLPDYDKSGRSLVQTQVADAVASLTAGRGRKPAQDYDIYQLTDVDAKTMRTVIEKEYLKDQRISIVDAYASLVNQHYSFLDGNNELHVNPPGGRPSQRQFHRFLLRNYDIETRVRGRMGDSDFEREHRKVLSTVMADCRGVGHYYEIDSTIADVFLVASDNVNKIIGKPTLYLIIDRKSRLIVGFYFGLENASWTGALQSILSISEDKRALCERYGVAYRPEDWPAHQVFPEEFLGDRGDMISRNSSNITEGLAVTVSNLPALRPEWKPLVECGFRLLHNSIRSIAPAYDPPSNVTRRRGKHFEKDACMTLRDFGNLIVNTIISHNRREILNYDMSTQELLDGVRPSPLELWNHGVATRSGLLTRYPAEVVRFALLPKAQAVVTEKGIEFKDCFYSFPEAIANKWFERARKSRFKVDVSFDMRLVDSIYVHQLNGKGEPYVATLTERSTKYRGYSVAEVHFYEARRAAIRIDSVESRLQNKVDLDNTTRPGIAAAEKRLKTQGQKASRTSRRADIVLDRRAELTRERVTLAAIDGGKPTTPPPTQSLATTANSALPAGANSMEARLAAARARMQQH